MDRAADLRRDYDLLGEKLEDAKGSDAASLARERRMIGELLEAIEKPTEVPFVDEVAQRRAASGRDPRPAKGRRKSG